MVFHTFCISSSWSLALFHSLRVVYAPVRSASERSQSSVLSSRFFICSLFKPSKYS